MNILYLLTRDLDATGQALRTEHEKANTVAVLDLRATNDYGRIVEMIAAADRVISW